MIRAIFIGLFLLAGSALYPQKILVLENIQSLKNYKYFQGDKIVFQLANNKSRISDNIFELTDNTVIFERLGEVKISNITSVYRDIWMLETLSGLSLIGGLAYFGIDGFNRTINHEYPVVQNETMLISGTMVAFGLALFPLRYRKITISEKWHLKSFDRGTY